jgi:hypothetical protein
MRRAITTRLQRRQLVMGLANKDVQTVGDDAAQRPFVGAWRCCGPRLRGQRSAGTRLFGTAWDLGQKSIRVNAISTGKCGHWRPARRRLCGDGGDRGKA